ncbi:MAG: hypothetical protein PWQ14_1039 [Rikenellaceae bacterium]|nr:hypothetical protein [Rikenellaceae bacterium]
MKQIIVFFLIFIVFINISLAQNIAVIGKDTIDTQTLEAIQFVHPEFAFTPDTEFFKAQLYKSYILPHAYADSARKVGLDKNPAVQKQLDKIKKIVEDYYLANILQKQEIKIEISEIEAKDYYNRNITQFTEPGNYSYLVAYITDTSKSTIELVKNQLINYSKMSNTLDQFKIGKEGVYNISFDKNITLYTSDPFYNYLKDATIGKLIGPLPSDDRLIMFLIIEKTPEKVKSFNEVKNLCYDGAMNEKKNIMDKNFYQKILKEYPIILNSDFFNKP